MRKLLVGALAAPLALASSATAATVTTHKNNSAGRKMSYIAAAGEPNDVVAVVGARHRVTVTDRGAPLTATGACASLDLHSATCQLVPEAPVNVALGDRDDRFATRRPFKMDLLLDVNGGPGNDVLSGGSNAWTDLRGGEGNDLLHAMNFGGPPRRSRRRRALRQRLR